MAHVVAFVALATLGSAQVAAQELWTARQLEDRVQRELLVEGVSLERLQLTLTFCDGQVPEGGEARAWTIRLARAEGNVAERTVERLAVELEAAAAEVVTIVNGMLSAPAVVPAEASPPDDVARPASAAAVAPRFGPGPLTALSQVEPASPLRALGLSLGVPILAVGIGFGLGKLDSSLAGAGSTLAGFGLLLGPSSGHLYSGQYGRAGLFTLGRFGCAAVAGAGSALVSTAFLFGFGADKGDTFAAGILLVLLGGAGFSTLAIWEPIDAYFSTKRLNAEAGVAVSLSPLIVPPQPRRKAATGLALSVAY